MERINSGEKITDTEAIEQKYIPEAVMIRLEINLGTEL